MRTSSFHQRTRQPSVSAVQNPSVQITSGTATRTSAPPGPATPRTTTTHPTPADTTNAMNSHLRETGAPSRTERNRRATTIEKRQHTIPANVKRIGNVAYTREEVQRAFDFLDVHSRGTLQARDVAERLHIFYPHMTSKEIRFLFPAGTSEPFTADTLWSLLDTAVLENFDAVEEAFKVYDPSGSGAMQPDALQRVLQRMRLAGEESSVREEDVNVLMRWLDQDGDGVVTLDDFRSILTDKAQDGVQHTHMGV